MKTILEIYWFGNKVGFGMSSKSILTYIAGLRD